LPGLVDHFNVVTVRIEDPGRIVVRVIVRLYRWRDLLSASALQQRVCRYSMTSSARPISAFGTMRPSALAVLRLITNSYLVGACFECYFNIPSRIGEVIDLTLLVEDIGRSSLAIAILSVIATISSGYARAWSPQ
jgi:hypothetical protein